MGKTAFDAARFSGFRFDPTKLVIVGLDTDDDPEHPLWDERIEMEIDEAMVVNIMKFGVKEAVIVHKVGDQALVVDGRRRTVHSRLANERLAELGEPLVQVPVMVEKGSDEQLAHIAISLNEIRKADDVIIKAAKAGRMVGRGSSESEVAIAFGVTSSTIKNWMKLVELPSPVKKAVTQGHLSASAASKLHGQPRKEQLAKLEKLLAGAKKTGKRVTATAVKSNGKKTRRKPTGKQLEGYVGKLSHRTDPFAQGVIAGLQLSMGKERPDVEDLLVDKSEETGGS